MPGNAQAWHRRERRRSTRKAGVSQRRLRLAERTFRNAAASASSAPPPMDTACFRLPGTVPLQIPCTRSHAWCRLLRKIVARESSPPGPSAQFLNGDEIHQEQTRFGLFHGRPHGAMALNRMPRLFARSTICFDASLHTSSRSPTDNIPPGSVDQSAFGRSCPRP